MEHRNIDHVAITPSAVLSIETKFIGAGRDWASDPWQARTLRDARASARAVKSLLRSQRLNVELPVVPVLMLWGAGSPKLQEPDLIDTFTSCMGPTLSIGSPNGLLVRSHQTWPARSKPDCSRSSRSATSMSPRADLEKPRARTRALSRSDAGGAPAPFPAVGPVASVVRQRVGKSGASRNYRMLPPSLQLRDTQ